MIHRVRADEVDPETDVYVNRPGRFVYRFPIHRVVETHHGLLRIEYGATHVVARPGDTVLVERPDIEVDLTTT